MLCIDMTLGWSAQVIFVCTWNIMASICFVYIWNLASLHKCGLYAHETWQVCSSNLYTHDLASK
jgi:hypothetical protein